MRPSRREWIVAGSGAALATTRAQSKQAAATAQSGSRTLNTLEIARRHPMLRAQPTPDFFEGLLLGNGDLGVCVTVRPDALGLHIGKNDAWDIRVSEEHSRHIKTFQEVLDLWKRAGEEAKRQGRPDMTFLESRIDFFREYSERMQSSYRKPWPRPWPCGTVWLQWDARMVRLVRQKLDIASAILTLDFQYDDLRGRVKPFQLTCFVHREVNHVLVRSDVAIPVLSCVYYPHWEAEAKLPDPLFRANGNGFSGFQEFPAVAPTDAQPDPPKSADDRSVAIEGLLQGDWRAEESETPRMPGRVRLLPASAPQPLRLDFVVLTSRDAADPAKQAHVEVVKLSRQNAAELQKQSGANWAKFWSASAVEIADRELERIWYWNQYWLACCLKPGKIAPGLFGNWSSGKIGTAWHGDYHMNYNTQQVWWGVFSSNHVEQHEPYTRLVESLLPMAEWNAKVQFGLPGVYFPHSAYPVPSKVNPYPAPPWGYEICETPWTVQSLWWQYRYTLDLDYLRRVYPILRAAAEFLAAFVTRGDDGRYHIVPTVSPENWGATVDFRLNRDCIIDLALTEFLLDAVVEGSIALGIDAPRRDKWREIRANLAPYPEGVGPFGRVWLDVRDAPHEYVYNVPVTLAPVFPAEQVGLGSRPEALEIARRTARTVRLEGGNDLVWQPIVRARLGILDLDWFKREVRYCTTPLGVANDRVRQAGGRYSDRTNFDFMMRMGVWTENLSLPAVINECLLQSHDGVIRLFPNRKGLGRASFRDLRAAGAFLVSASFDGKEVSEVVLKSEKGATVRIEKPWKQVSVRRLGQSIRVSEKDGVIEFSTNPGGVFVMEMPY